MKHVLWKALRGVPHYRIVTIGGVQAGAMSQLADGQWIAVDANDRRLTDETFKTPANGRAWFDKRMEGA